MPMEYIRLEVFSVLHISKRCTRKTPEFILINAINYEGRMNPAIYHVSTWSGKCFVLCQHCQHSSVLADYTYSLVTYPACKPTFNENKINLSVDALPGIECLCNTM